MNKFELLIAMWLVDRIVKQGNHKQKLTDLFTIIHNAVEKEFTEDNEPTRAALITDCLNES